MTFSLKFFLGGGWESNFFDFMEFSRELKQTNIADTPKRRILDPPLKFLTQCRTIPHPCCCIYYCLLQWGIQDFPEEALTPRDRGTNLLFCQIFLQINCMKIKKIRPGPRLKCNYVDPQLFWPSGRSASRRLYQTACPSILP